MYLHIICVCVSVYYICYIYLGICSQRALLPMWATLRFIVCMSLCVCTGEKKGGLRGNQHTTRHNAPNAARNELRLAYTVRDMLFVCLPALLLLFLSKNTREKRGKTQFKLS